MQEVLTPHNDARDRSTARFARVRSLDVKLLGLVWGLLLLVIAAYTWAAWREVSVAARTAAQERLARVTEELATLVSRSPLEGLHEAASQPEILALVQDSGTPDPAAGARPILDDLNRAQTVSITVRASDGRTLLEVPGPAYDPALDAETQPLADLTGAQDALSPRGEATAAGTLPQEEIRGPLRAAADRVYYDRGVAIEVDGRLVGTLMERRQVAPVDSGLEVIEGLIGSDAVFLLGNASDDLWTDLRTVVPGPDRSAFEADYAVPYDRAGAKRFGLVALVEGTPFALLVEFPLATVVAPARSFLVRSLAVGGLLLVIGAAVSVLLGRRIIAPLHQLAEAAEAIANGDYSRRVPVTGYNEIGALSDSFNHMAQEVENARGRDNSRRAAAEEARSHSEEYFRALVESSLDIVAVIDEGGRLSFASASTRRHLGLDPEQLSRSAFRELVHPNDWKEIQLALRHAATPGETRDLEFRCRNASGEWRVLRGVSCDLRHNPVIGGVLLNLHDVTRHLQLEDELRQAHKMEAVGRLAGGIAHDFNNLLTAMNGSLEFVRKDYDLPAPALHDLELASSAAARAAQLVRQLLAFGRQQAIEPSVVDPNEVIDGISDMLARLVGEHISVQTALEPTVDHIRVDRNQFEQVLLNLAVNARDAMAEGGTLTLTTTSKQTETGPVVHVSVTDDGTGMDEATKERIFEPFFTTKAENVGTGLGLSTVYGIMSQSGARVDVHSAVGRGTTFDLVFPGVEAVATPAPEPLPESPSAALVSGASILVVEDQDHVAALVKRALAARSFVVRSASGVKEALKTLAEDGASFDLLLTDVGLPDGRGPDVAEAAQALHPGLQVLLMTGYDRHRVQSALDHPVLEKPFTLEQLTETVDQLLAGSSRAMTLADDIDAATAADQRRVPA